MAFEPDMKLTSEFVEIMGGKMEAQPFRSEKKILVMGTCLNIKLVSQFTCGITMDVDSDQRYIR